MRSTIAVLANTGALPDVVLMDLQMPDMDGITATAEIKRRWPEVEVVAVTSCLLVGAGVAVLGAVVGWRFIGGRGWGAPDRSRQRYGDGPQDMTRDPKI